MGTNITKPALKPEPVLQKWRKEPPDISWDHEGYNRLVSKLNSVDYVVRQRNVECKQLRILLLGENGQGKSSFINTLNAAVTGKCAQIALTASTSIGHVTSTYREYVIIRDKLDMNGQEVGEELELPFLLCDLRGFGEKGRGVSDKDVEKAILGHLESGQRLEPDKTIREIANSGQDSTTNERKVCMILFVVDATQAKFLKSTSSIDDRGEEVGEKGGHERVLKNIQDAMGLAFKLEVPMAIILTKVDKIDATVAKDLSKLHFSESVHDAVLEASINIGIDVNKIFPVKNITEEQFVSDVLAIQALLPLYHLAVDIEQNLKQKEYMQK